MATETHEGVTRRDMLVLAGPAFFAVGGAVSLWPFIDQMNPDANAVALSTIEIDVSPIESGQAITVMWQGKPVFIRNRTEEEVSQSKAVPLADLPDPQSDAQRTKSGKENWLVMIGICTHLGCIPKGQAVGDVKGEYGGWFCPCHGSHYDTAGRIRKGPAPRNLDVPPYAFLTDTSIRIG
ncbi:MAG: ubiquinol-cytochrome c reductase iron-sulfur subunit [Pseudomonadota bacterium]